MEDFLVISVKHTMRRDRYITLWRPNDCGYCYTVENAGKYTKDQISGKLGYYNSGCDSVAIPFDSLSHLLVRAHEHDGDAIPNNAKTWKTIKKSFVFIPEWEMKPEYKGAPRREHEYS